ncbi:MAG: aspartate dehydrogenase [Clostridia bacterium]|nr:aspartate dehydrogenase [Clostridia bacterium]
MIFRKKTQVKAYDRLSLQPMLHKSICTGETTAGFKDLKTGKFTDIMLISDEKDLQTFMQTYGISERPQTEY